MNSIHINVKTDLLIIRVVFFEIYKMDSRKRYMESFFKTLYT